MTTPAPPPRPARQIRSPGPQGRMHPAFTLRDGQPPKPRKVKPPKSGRERPIYPSSNRNSTTATAPDPKRIAQAVKRAEAQVVNRHNASFAGCKIDGPVFRIGKRSWPINKVSAELEIGAQQSSGRTTLTRLVAGGAIAGGAGLLIGGAAKKRTDTTRLYLTVRTPDGGVEVRDAPATEERTARKFMASLEMASKRMWPLTSSAGTVLPLAESSVRADPQRGRLTGGILIGVLLLFWGLAWHPALIVLAVYMVAAAVVFVVTEHRDAEALEHYRRSSGTA